MWREKKELNKVGIMQVRKVCSLFEHFYRNFICILSLNEYFKWENVICGD